MKERKLVTSDWHEMPDHLMVLEQREITVIHFVRRLALDRTDSVVEVLILLAVWKQTNKQKYHTVVHVFLDYTGLLLTFILFIPS